MDISSVTRPQGSHSAQSASPRKDSGASSADEQGVSEQQLGGPPFTSPIVNFDSTTGAAILEFRDANSGTVEFQLPSRSTLQYAQAKALVGEKAVGEAKADPQKGEAKSNDDAKGVGKAVVV